MTVNQAPSAAEQTRLALIQAALKLFGEKGFDATSTRQIASSARANMGSIAYHFGSKEGLRAACADHIVETIQAVTDQALRTYPAAAPATHVEAREMLSAGLGRLVDFIVVRPEAGAFVQFILRELAHPTPALDRIYTGVFEPTHRRLCMLWETATGEPAEAERTKLTVFTIIGQVVYFRIGREAVMRRMGWSAIGQEEAGRIVATARFNLDAVLAARDRQAQ